MTSTQGRWAWRKSSFSNGNGNSSCVEVGYAAGEVTALRDSKNPDGGMLTVPTTGWDAFRRTLGGSKPGPQ